MTEGTATPDRLVDAETGIAIRFVREFNISGLHTPSHFECWVLPAWLNGRYEFNRANRVNRKMRRCAQRRFKTTAWRAL